jgi:hypothetical protein
VICEVAEFLGVGAVTPVVMRDNSKTACGSQLRESGISTVVFAQTMKNLYHTDDVAQRQPVRASNYMFIRCR